MSKGMQWFSRLPAIEAKLDLLLNASFHVLLKEYAILHLLHESSDINKQADALSKVITEHTKRLTDAMSVISPP